MNFNAFGERKWKMRRNQSTGSLMLALNTRTNNFQKASARVAKSRSKLHETKINLRRMIKEYKKVEREVMQKKIRYEQTVGQLEAVIEEMRTPDYDVPEREELALWYFSESTISNAKAEVEDIDTELADLKMIDSRADNPNNASLSNTIPVNCSIMISDIDSSGSIQRNGVAKLTTTKKCSLCVKNEINSIFYDCKHECCCIDCATNLTKNNGRCPICQSLSKRVIRTYAM
ncbi:uncharacterized protein LOC135833190 [Planococcus citri]|uniref:uncharacterized protein LOC135833190 n=1 Tax=Planococcus citri TaxID=170843 RepID=UPI0031F974E0